MGQKKLSMKNVAKAQKYFVTGIGTEIGKTVVSSILVELLEADYWKPVQAGDLKNTDTMKVQSLISNAKSHFHAEAYALRHPISPHAAAERENVAIQFDDLVIPNTSNHLVIEGAGGLMVPLNATQLFLDWLSKIQISTIVVSRHYLGSINHTLLTLEVLRHYQIPIQGIIFNGEENKDTESFILNYSQIPLLGILRPESDLTPLVIKRYAEQWRSNFFPELE